MYVKEIVHVKAEEKRRDAFLSLATEGFRVQGRFFHASNHC